jgi:hypothetical protein
MLPSFNTFVCRSNEYIFRGFMSRTEQLVKDIRKLPIFQQLIPMEAGIGWPIPVRKEGQLYVKLLFFGQSRAEGRQGVALFPPLATMTLNWKNGVVVEYVNLRFQNPAPELNWQDRAGIFPHLAVKQMSVSEYKQKRQELYAMYDSLLDTLDRGGSRSPEEDRKFAELFTMLLEPSLTPYYRAIAGKFVDSFLLSPASR